MLRIVSQHNRRVCQVIAKCVSGTATSFDRRKVPFYQHGVVLHDSIRRIFNADTHVTRRFAIDKIVAHDTASMAINQAQRDTAEAIHNDVALNNGITGAIHVNRRSAYVGRAVRRISCVTSVAASSDVIQVVISENDILARMNINPAVIITVRSAGGIA